MERLNKTFCKRIRRTNSIDSLAKEKLFLVGVFSYMKKKNSHQNAKQMLNKIRIIAFRIDEIKGEQQ